MRTTAILGLGFLLLGALGPGCGQWPDGAEVSSGEPGAPGVPVQSDPAGPSPTSRLPAERGTTEPSDAALAADVRQGAPLLPPSAGGGKTLDIEEAARSQGTSGSGSTIGGTTTGGATTGGATTGGATTGGGTTGGATTGGGTTGGSR